MHGELALGDIVTIHLQGRTADSFLLPIVIDNRHSGEYVKVKRGEIGLIVGHTDAGNFIVYFAKRLISATRFEIRQLTDAYPL